MIVVDNIPKVEPAKIAKLRAVILKTYTQIAAYLQGDDIHMPIDPATGQSTGFCFIKFNTKSEAEIAVDQTNDDPWSNLPTSNDSCSSVEGNWTIKCIRMIQNMILMLE